MSDNVSHLNVLQRYNGTKRLIITSLTSPNKTQRGASARFASELLFNTVVHLIAYSRLIFDLPGNFRARDRAAAIARDVISDATRVPLQPQRWRDASWEMESSPKPVKMRILEHKNILENL